ncbi:MAG: phosphoadenosine phosphosulfate reductase family protein [Treponema sp.]|nr:phosphoadenosine phosphosulfate reductase family protein [Treponema sp.]
MVPYKFLLDSKFKISDMCCTIMKKKPAKEYEKETDLHTIIGTMTIESKLRENAWLRNGCNSFDSIRPISTPISFWTEQDVLEYIKLNNLPIASVYGEIVGDRETGYRTTGLSRTGCMFCLFGIRKEKTPNRIQRMAQTHPKLYDYFLNKLGMRELMEFINVPYKPVDDQNEAN